MFKKGLPKKYVIPTLEYLINAHTEKGSAASYPCLEWYWNCGGKYGTTHLNCFIIPKVFQNNAWCLGIRFGYQCLKNGCLKNM